MKNVFFLAACLVISSQAMAQTKVPNLGDKQCALWTGVSDQAKLNPDLRNQVLMMDWWALGYLKGTATQYALASKESSPLIKLRNDEELDWMRSYCRLNWKLSISDAANALLEELRNRP